MYTMWLGGINAVEIFGRQEIYEKKKESLDGFELAHTSRDR